MLLDVEARQRSPLCVDSRFVLRSHRKASLGRLPCPLLPASPACRYSEAIDLKPDKAALPALHSNRCLAYMKAQRYGDALRDAEAAARLAPGWSKAHWRCGTALLALKRTPEAVLAFLEAWRLAAGDARAECEGRLRQAVQRLTREQLGRGILALMEGLQGEGRMEAPQVEEASEQELAEGMFRHLKEEHRGQPRPGPYYKRWAASSMRISAATPRSPVGSHAAPRQPVRKVPACHPCLQIPGLAAGGLGAWGGVHTARDGAHPGPLLPAGASRRAGGGRGPP